MKRNLVLICYIIVISLVNGQEKNIQKAYQNYFEDTREMIHLHFNKTSFLSGEKAWFQAYVKELNSNKLHPYTSNLFVTVFEENGTMKEQHLIEINNGIGTGQIAIDSTFTKDTYYIKAATKWMQNLNEKNSYQQKIKIIASQPNRKAQSVTLTEEDFFDFQLFPEGGHFIGNIENTIGVLIKDSKNKGVKILEGNIKNSNNNIVSTFSTNQFGLGRTSFFLPTNEIFTVEIKLDNGSVLTKNIPKGRKIGVSLKTVSKPESIDILIQTNATTLALLKGKTYKVFVHNTRKFKEYAIRFDSDNLGYRISLDREEIPNGINIITLFNDNNSAVSERIVYNDSFDLFFNVNIDKINKTKDSLKVRLTNTSEDKINISTSFLPSATKAYSRDKSILYSFLLKPYLKGYIENPEYYFNSSSFNRLDNFDLLLQTQGWSKYNWTNIFYKKNDTKFKFENGFDVKFKLNQKLKKNQTVMIFSEENNFVSELKSDKTELLVKNSFFKKNSKFYFGFKAYNNSFSKIAPNVQYWYNPLPEQLNTDKVTKSEKSELLVSNFKTLTDGVNVLDEVVVKTRKKITKDRTPFGKATMLTTFEMDKMVVTGGDMVLEFLALKRFKVEDRRGRIFIGRRRSFNNPSLSSNSDDYTEQLRNVRVYLDDNEITASLWMLREIPLNMVKSISFGQDPAVFNETIYIYSLSPEEYSRNNSEFSEFYLTQGFAKSKKYYNPKYPSFLEESYLHYGAIFWKPTIELEPNSSVNFTIPTNKQDEIKVFLEGISTNGKLISKEQNISLK